MARESGTRQYQLWELSNPLILVLHYPVSNIQFGMIEEDRFKQNTGILYLSLSIGREKKSNSVFGSFLRAFFSNSIKSQKKTGERTLFFEKRFKHW